MSDNMEIVATPPCPKRKETFQRNVSTLKDCARRSTGLVIVLAALVVLSGARRAEASWALSNAFPNLSFDHPVGLYPEPHSSRLYVTEWDRRVYSFTNNPSTSQKTLVLDLSAVTQSSNDCGFMGLTFHPEFGMTNSTKPRLFLCGVLLLAIASRGAGREYADV